MGLRFDQASGECRPLPEVQVDAPAASARSKSASLVFQWPTVLIAFGGLLTVAWIGLLVWIFVSLLTRLF
jgi:hypothetical protein